MKNMFGSIEVVPAVLKCATWCTLVVVPSGAVSFTLRVKVFASFRSLPFAPKGKRGTVTGLSMGQKILAKAVRKRPRRFRVGVFRSRP